MKQLLAWQILLKCRSTQATLNLSHKSHTLLPWNTMIGLRMKSVSSYMQKLYAVIICLIIDNTALNKVTWKFIWPMPKVKDIFSKLNSAQYFSAWIFELDTITYPLMTTLFLKQPSCCPLENTNTQMFLLDQYKHQHTFRNSWAKSWMSCHLPLPIWMT